MWWESYLPLQAVRKWEILAYIFFFFMFTFPNKGDTLDFFSVRSLSLSLWCVLFWFCPDSVFTRESLMARAGLPCVEWVPFTFHSQCGVTKSKWMLVNNDMLSHHFFSEESKKKKKRCKNVVNVWLKVSLAGLHISDSFVYQRNTIALKKEERFAVLYIKWCLFSILTLQVTSEGATSTGFCTYM